MIIAWVGIRYKLTRFHSDHSKGHITSFKLTVHISTFLEPITEHDLAIVTGLIEKFTLRLFFQSFLIIIRYSWTTI